MIKVASLVIPLLSIVSCGNPEAEKELSGNPVLPGWYADPEITLFEQKYWIFPTFSARFEKQVFMDAFSSDDLVNWTKHSNIIDTTSVKWAREAMWAPCAVEKEGQYFLFFAANDIQRPESPWFRPGSDDPNEVGGIGIGVAAAPHGPYQDYLGHPLIGEVYNGAQPIDQFVFKDQNGQWYILYGGWGHCNIGRLNDDFTGLIPFEDDELTIEITPEGYVEGPVMFFRDNQYYFMWSEGSWTNDSYQVAYAIGDKPWGPFDRIGTILTSDPEIATGAGHHSVLNIPGTNEWYIAYHRRPIPNEDRDHRVVCIDRMYFNEDGTIKPVIMTFNGVERKELQK